jgi:hypothetical protein
MGKTTKPTQPRYDVLGRYTALLDAGETQNPNYIIYLVQ